MQPSDYGREFVAYLRARSEDAGLMASLRRGLADPSSPEVHRVVQRWLSEGDPEWLESVCMIVGPLFALHHDEEGRGDPRDNMGTHFRRLAPGKDLPPNIERRFLHLLSSDANELGDALRQAVKLLKTNQVPVNWERLFDDVRRWSIEGARDDVRKKWARAFWRTERRDERPKAEPTPASTQA